MGKVFFFFFLFCHGGSIGRNLVLNLFYLEGNNKSHEILSLTKFSNNSLKTKERKKKKKVEVGVGGRNKKKKKENEPSPSNCWENTILMLCFG